MPQRLPTTTVRPKEKTSGTAANLCVVLLAVIPLAATLGLLCGRYGAHGAVEHMLATIETGMRMISSVDVPLS